MSTTVPQSAPDPLLDEIRAVKQSVSAQFGHDVGKLCQHLRREQERSTRRMVHRTPRPDAARKARRSDPASGAEDWNRT